MKNLLSLSTLAMSTFGMALFLASPIGAAEPLLAESVVLRLLVEAEVAAGEAGLIVEMKVAEGDHVKQGQLLARIDDSAPRIAQQAAQAELAVAQAEVENDIAVRYAKKALEVAKSELARSEESVAKFPRSISQSQLDVERLKVDELELEIERAEHELALARLRVDVARAKLEAARLEIARRRVVAPLDAVAVSVDIHPGEWVEPGQKLVRLVSTTRLKAEGFIPAAAAGQGLAGAPVVATLDGQTAPVSGKITFVSPEIDPITRQVRIWATIDNPEGKLRPGQQVRLEISLTESQP